MDIFLQHISFHASEEDVVHALQNILHQAPFQDPLEPLLNFHVRLFPDKRGCQKHAGSGLLTLSRPELGQQFLSYYTELPKSSGLFTVKGRAFVCSASQLEPRQDVLQRLSCLPFTDTHQPSQTHPPLRSSSEKVNLTCIQFGFEAQGVFSPEWERQLPERSGFLIFDDDRREIRISMIKDINTLENIAIPYNRIKWSGKMSDHDTHSLFFSLECSPVLERQQIHGTQDAQRKRISFFDEQHRAVAPFTMLSVRLELHASSDLHTFLHQAGGGRITQPQNFPHVVEKLSLFSPEVLNELTDWLADISWEVAFQCSALLHNSIVHPRELLSLRDEIAVLCSNRIPEVVSASSSFRPRPASLSSLSTPSEPCTQVHNGLTDCWHVRVTPTAFLLEGPYPDRSNRVLRFYKNHHTHFLRVSFEDEARLQYRFDRDLSTEEFVNHRVGGLLKNGFCLGGRHFQFLAFSMSALHEHTVWFMHPFHDPTTGNFIDANIIREDLGIFETSLMRCPARYAARISQAFTTTDASITLNPDEVSLIRDIEHNISDKTYTFTDGVGTCSQMLAEDIWEALQNNRKSCSLEKHCPSVYQIRYQGAKGMISVDHRLYGRSLRLRPSMLKFNAPHSQHVEIARAFTRPSVMFLNRPLIMLLEGLGVPAESFLELQRAAVQEVNDSTKNLKTAARLLENYGLGYSFRMIPLLLELQQLHLTNSTKSDDNPPFIENSFLQRMLVLAQNHILREFKTHARVAVPGSWNLVGVADVFDQLKENEIFACVKDQHSNEIQYLQGQVLISRSPQIHPGDVQLVTAIGKPELDSPLSEAGLVNCIVFPCRGNRPLPSCLGGGDLDGDTYIITSRAELFPTRCFPPGTYEPAPKRLLDRPATIEDIADFVCDYINTDHLGMIATKWLTIADQTGNILDKDCMTLAKLHSDAVDFQKSGTPIDLKAVPKPRHRRKPDWAAPETLDVKSSKDYYISHSAVGRLYRDVTLPPAPSLSSNRTTETEGSDLDPDVKKSLEDNLSRTLRLRIQGLINVTDPTDDGNLERLFSSYVSQLRYIAATYSITPREPLTEEELVIGTISAKTTQPRLRRSRMAQFRDQTQHLVDFVREELEGYGDATSERWLLSSWEAWEFAKSNETVFGAKSFGWIAMGSLFDAITAIEEATEVEVE
ncbi:RdRP-domain-containing protein [Sistotremastrum suecicum HHB10207 ss-3]|uniref:RNA-dependent RNA polymerase n=1 Tax=Sistotremastrum suecicum HHB10207 ss-3 TaxID=1314776 RepID=A0A166EXV8_9AGAM|nr:RdRP-domain-containing protein [Sistotremastrum suecicum HHB10207 ss-3]